MEHQDHTKSSWREYLCSQTQAELGAKANWPEIGGEVKSSNAHLDEQVHLYRNVWTDSEPARVKNWTGRSFAMDARIRLDSLKSGCNSPQPWGNSDDSFYYYDSEKDLWNGGHVEEEQSALDEVEILDMEESIGDEESWLYEPPNRPSFEEREPALRWCRHVLDNPSPEMEAARRGLMNKLDPNHVKVTHPDDFMTTSYRLQDITDVHIMARIQEDSLRQDYISMPAAALLRRNSDVFSSFLNTEADHAGDVSSRNKSTAPDCACKPGLTAAGSFSCKLPTPAAKQVGQSPKLTKLHQQVTQFKLLRLAQNKASPGRMRSPLQTSLRSLQAVRNSRSLEVDVSQPAGQSDRHPPVVPSSGTASSLAAYLNSSDIACLAREFPDRVTAVKRLQRSQSLSPSRIAHPSKGYLSVRGRVFASPDRVSTAAWGRHASSVQR
ncbi:SLAIN motif-containing protein-like isoform X2 [Poecilia latipinna]|uniref:SLAIN motif-containing protein-like isoform X2 n=1 Tax=Poecilia latipinna TaxID=48699 RepID=UPI00072DA029|nr:PREDICTED: SLAIN motif-containing protein-like isoform X2 [Poecilia latipinna]